MRVFTLAIILLLSTVIQSGCAFKDIDKRILIVAIGIDPAENSEGYKVTLKIALPVASVKQASGPRFAYFTEESETVGESLRILETHIDKVLEFGHVKAIVINEELFKDGIEDFMDYFTRRADIQLIAYVIAARPSAEEILKIEPDTEAASTVSLLNFFDDTGTESPYITTSFLFQFRRDYLGKGIDSFVPIIETNEEKNELIVNKAIVSGEGSDPIVLDQIKTKYYNSLFKSKAGMDYKVEDDNLTFMLYIDKVKMSYKIIEEDKKPTSIKINAKFVGIIGQSNHALSQDKLNHYNELSEKAIKEKMTDFFKTLQEAGLDPGFGLRYRATRLNSDGLYEKWEEAYKDLPIDINVTVKLKSTGALE
ncbi:Ger(x)C family spore germination protein [Sporosarcina sp. Sa2YVA2]|uniref:Ger(X)C family spore germination protein n=1 Tax=Sporosarcina quadrami TaxID=2762234 RepID=A0ABR8UDN4_9BACL|nr:Ger(x)C family spore germination protein [Sporosarcina quadrami]MBD7986121.1 Ger(x)C family spore germination protein [Sporosarcina quadrami]